MDELITWLDVAARLAPLERGAQSRLAGILGIDPSYFSRRLRSAVELTVTEQRKVNAFFANEPEAPFPSDSVAAMDQIAARPALKVFGWAAMSEGDRIAIADDRVLDMMPLPPGLNLDPQEYFVILPAGSSMEPRIFAGEPQIVRRNYPPARDKICLIEFRDGTGALKAYRGQHDGKVFAEQYNPQKVLDYDASSVKGIHAVWLRL